MGLGETFDNLEKELEAVNDALVAVRKAVDDCPEEHQLESELDHSVLELSATMQDALAAIRQGRQAVDQMTLDAGLQALTSCHEYCLNLCEQFLAIGSYERLARIARFGRKHSGEWPGWADTVVAQISDCLQKANCLQRALLITWRELSERLAARAPTTSFTAIGQQIHFDGGKKKRRSRV